MGHRLHCTTSVVVVACHSLLMKLPRNHEEQKPAFFRPSRSNKRTSCKSLQSKAAFFTAREVLQSQGKISASIHVVYVNLTKSAILHPFPANPKQKLAPQHNSAVLSAP